MQEGRGKSAEVVVSEQVWTHVALVRLNRREEPLVEAAPPRLPHSASTLLITAHFLSSRTSKVLPRAMIFLFLLKFRLNHRWEAGQAAVGGVREAYSVL